MAAVPVPLVHHLVGKPIPAYVIAEFQCIQFNQLRRAVSNSLSSATLSISPLLYPSSHYELQPSIQEPFTSLGNASVIVKILPHMAGP